jgi:hypothetical protein
MGAGEIAWIEVLSVMKVTGIVAAYNMIPSGDTLVDISGEGNDGTINGAMSSKEGMRFNNIDTFISLADHVFTGMADAGSIAVRVLSHDLSSNGNVLTLGNGYIIVSFSAAGHQITALVYDGIDATFMIIPVEPEQWFDFVLTWANGIEKIYINGLEAASRTYAANPSLTGANNIGSGIGSSFVGADIADMQFHNYAFNEQQAKDYHNQFAKQISQRHNFDDLGVGSTI